MLTTERKIQSGFALALLLACGVGMMFYYSVVRLRDDVTWVAHTQETIAALESLFGSVTDAVSSQRGYVITGKEEYLVTYHLAIRDVDDDLRRLRGLTVDNPAQRKRLDSLAALVGEREKFSKEINDLRQKSAVTAAQSLVATGRGNEIHNRIRLLIDEMTGVERSLLTERQARAQYASELAKAVILLGGLLTLAVIVTALFFIKRDFSGRRQADAMLRQTLDQLEDRVRERTAGLEQANKSLAASEARQQGVLQSAMDAIITVDERQNIVMFNTAAEKIFRCAAVDAVGGPLDRFIPERFRAGHRAHVERFGKTGTTTRMMGARLDLFGLRADGEEFPIDASISQVVADGRKLYTVILRDATERKNAETELRRAYQEWRAAVEQLTAIIQSAMDAVITVDQDQRIVLFNRAAETVFRCKSADAMGQSLDRFIPERFRAAHRRHVENFGDTRVTTRMMGSRLVLSGLRSNGEEFPIDASISQVTVDGRKLYTVILRDITERKRAEDALANSYQELRDLSAAMHQVREAERLRIARELHDELAQWLTAIKMDVAWIAARLPAGEARLAERAKKARGLVDTTVAAVRRIAADLRPVMLDDLGLVAALESLLHDVSERTGIVVSLDAGDSGLDFGEPLASSFYRIAQEALTNIVRHAAATEARVELRVEGDILALAVSDNGKGIDLAAAARSKSYGIIGIRERAHTLGGTARIVPMETGGTRVEIRVPMARYRAGGTG